MTGPNQRARGWNAAIVLAALVTAGAPARADGPPGLLVLGVGLGFADGAHMARTAAEWDIDYETYWLPADEKDAAVRLLPDGLPTVFLVGPRGVTRYDRLLRDEELERLVPPLLGPPPPLER